MKKWVSRIVIVPAFILLWSISFAGEAPGPKKWEFYLTPYFWAPDLDVTSTIDGVEAELDLSFSDLVENFDTGGFSGRVEAWNNRLGLIFDGQYVSIQDEFSGPIAGLVNINSDTQQTTLDFAVGYRIWDQRESSGWEGRGAVWFEPYFGFRYVDLKQVVDFVPGPDLGGSKDWVEVFAGGRLVWLISRKWTFAARTDFGGFGIGSASDLTWNLLAGFDYRFGRVVSGKLGYKIYSIDYLNGSGSTAFGMDGTQQGPWLGLTFKL